MTKLLILLFFPLCISYAGDKNPDLGAFSQMTYEELAKLSEREIGQKRFTVKSSYYGRPKMLSDRPGAARNLEGGREIQESDVFKLGKQGEKEVFLLNRYRGFQVISFKENKMAPKILSRYPIYNNWSSEMYYSEKTNMVFILNTEWVEKNNSHWGINYQTVVYALDVSDTSNPILKSKKEILGYLDSSRMVGDVLYVITESGSYQQERKAQVTSIRFDKELKVHDSKNLNIDKQWVQKLNVVASQNKYYVLVNTGTWNTTQSQVHVYDITNAQGNIKKIMGVQLKGRISEKSQMFIHDDHLVTVNNFRKDRNDVLKVAFESFKLQNSDEIKASAKQNQLILNDSNGLHARLQDVRVSGNLLYIFWVPANNIDPFDLVDISNLKNSPRYLGRLHFDGWISKSFPLEYKNQKYVLGLGWVVPNGQDRRVPQAKLFKIDEVDGKIQHSEEATILIDDEEIWSNLNGEDKLFHFVNNSEGKLSILMPVTFRKNYQQGGKILDVDLNKKSLSAGKSIKSKHRWLKRIFTNPELVQISAFNDQSMEVFSLEDQYAQTSYLLELARNIIDFEVIQRFRSLMALQTVLSDEGIELRLFPHHLVDGEKHQALEVLKIKGHYLGHIKSGTQTYFAMANLKTIDKTHTYSSGKTYTYKEEVIDSVDITSIDKQLFKVLNTIKLKPSDKLARYSADLKLIELGGKIVLKLNQEIFSINTEDQLKKLATADCEYFFKGRHFNILKVNDSLFFENAFETKVKNDKGYDEVFLVPFMKEIKIVDDQLECGESINTPGRLVSSDDDFILMTDLKQRGYFHPRPSYRSWIPSMIAQKTNSYVLKHSDSGLELVDYLEKNIFEKKIKNNLFLSFSAETSRFDLWKLSSEGDLLSRSFFMNNNIKGQLKDVLNIQGEYYVFIQNGQKIAAFKLDGKMKRLSPVLLKSNFVENKSYWLDGVFNFNKIVADPFAPKLYLQQGWFGVLELEFN